MAPTDSPQLRFRSFETSDPEALVEGLGDVVPGIRATPLRGSAMRARVVATRLLDVGFFTARFWNTNITATDPRPYSGATIPLHGTCRMTGSGEAIDVSAGMVHVARGGALFDARMTDDGCEFLAVLIGKDRTKSAAVQLECKPADEWDFDESCPAARPATGYFARRACEVWRALRAGNGLTESAISMEETADALTLSMVEAGMPGESDRTEGAMDHFVAIAAADYIVANLDAPLPLTEIAAQAGTSVRSLTRSFRQRYGMSPLQFARARRLEAVNRMLLVAEPGEATVTDAAMRFGFWHLGRFASYYRETFGESPSATLQRAATHQRLFSRI